MKIDSVLEMDRAVVYRDLNSVGKIWGLGCDV